MRAADVAIRVLTASAMCLGSAGIIAACRRTPTAPDPMSAPSTPPMQENDDDPKRGAAARDAGARRIVPASPCTADAPRYLPVTAPVDGTVAVARDSALWLAWIERSTATVVVQPPSGEPVRVATGEGDIQVPALAAATNEAFVAIPVQRGATRSHRVMRVHDGIATELFTTPEANDDVFDIALATTSTGLVIAWTDSITPEISSVMTQYVSFATARAGSIASPQPRALTTPDQDASDPVVVARADGTLVMAWLVAHEVDDVIANATTADVFVCRLAANGEPSSAPVQISPGPGNRFGVRLASAGDATWVAYRVAGDADQESQGDGGLVALMRLGVDLHPSASPVYVSDRDGNPSGPSAIVVDERGGATVFWNERQGDAITSWRRAAEPDGRMLRAANPEPMLRGEVPFGGDATRPWVLLRGERGEPGLLHLRCPPLPIPPVAAVPATHG